MSNISEEMDTAIAKLQQNFDDLRYHLEKAFLDEGRALLKFEAQWKDLKKEHKKDIQQRDLHLQQMGISIPSTGTEHFATANPNPNPNPNPTSWTNTTPRPPGNGTWKLYCDVCKIYCDTKAVLDKHKMGKKHRANLEKLKGKAVAGPSKKKAAGPAADLETKRRKVLESGAAAHALRTCAICNVLCLSDTDFYNHIAGQRHNDAVAMAKKHAAGTSSYSQLNRRF